MTATEEQRIWPGDEGEAHYHRVNQQSGKHL